MLIIKIALLGIIASIIAIILRRENGAFALILSLTTGLIIFNLIIPDLNNIFKKLKDISSSFNINSNYITILLKIIGIAYISEFASQLCIDAGESSIASKIEFSAKILIMIISIPVMNELLELIIHMMGS